MTNFDLIGIAQLTRLNKKIQRVTSENLDSFAFSVAFKGAVNNLINKGEVIYCVPNSGSYFVTIYYLDAVKFVLKENLNKIIYDL